MFRGLPTLTDAGSEVTRGQMLERPVPILQARFWTTRSIRRDWLLKRTPALRPR